MCMPNIKMIAFTVFELWWDTSSLVALQTQKSEFQTPASWPFWNFSEFQKYVHPHWPLGQLYTQYQNDRPYSY